MDKDTAERLAVFNAQDQQMIYEIQELTDLGMKLTAQNLQQKFYIGYNRAMHLIEKIKATEQS